MQVARATAVVTGGASGLGEATARRLHDGGSNVVLIDFNEEKGRALAVELGGRAMFFRADITVSEQLQRAMDAAVEEFGAIHALVNCAGTGGSAGKTASTAGPFDINEFKRVLGINLVGTFDATRLAAVKMIQNQPNEWGERGVIVNTSSAAAFDGQIGQAAYAASKAGIVGLTLVIARDLASYGIRACTIAPGIFDTPLLSGLSEEIRATLGKQVPFPPRLGRPDEFAMLAQQIVENPMLNGETIRLDGAVRMPPK